MKSTPWRVTVVQPRAGNGERSLYLRCRRTHNGRAEDSRISAATTDPREAARLALEHEADLNAGGRSLPAIMDARIVDLERAAKQGAKSHDSVCGFKNARARLAVVLDVEAVTRAELLRARDALVAEGLGAETVNTYLRRAAACWRWAEERGLVTTPWPRVRALEKPPRSKRPYTPTEAAAVLEWVRAHAPRWHALLSLIDDTGRRVSEVCRLVGADVDRREQTVRVRQKGRRALVLPVSPEVLALLPERAPDAWLFARRLRGGGLAPAHRDAVRRVVRRAIVALGIPDGERLDTHSLRRSFATDAHRARVPDEVTRRLSGHETVAMLGLYQRDAVGDDIRAAQADVRRYRASARRASTGTSPASTVEPDASPSCASPGAGRGVLMSAGVAEPLSAAPDGLATDSPGEVVAGPAPVSRHPSLVEREHDPLVVEACRVAAAHPEVARRLRADLELFDQIIAALDATEAERAERARKATS